MYNIRGQRGFLLVDLMVAVSIISIALLAIAASYTQSTKTTVSSTQYTFATNLAQRQLELLENQPTTYWSGLTLPADIPWQDNSFDPTTLLPPVSIVTTAKQCNEDSTNLVEVTVVVKGTAQKNNYNETFTAFFPKNKLK